MNVVPVDDKAAILAYLQRDPYLHLYEIGDLDEFFWPHTRWFGCLGADGALESMALLYEASTLPVLIAIASDAAESLAGLLATLQQRLPPRFYAHLTLGLEAVFAARFAREPHGRHLKMALREPGYLASCDWSGLVRLSAADRQEVEAFYRRSYPGNWFDPRMLDTGQYFGARFGGRLIAAGGVHVVSHTYRVAALGNIATDPEHRGEGLATRVTARVCASLRESVEHVGLNVKADNAAAMACYRKLGFEVIGEYDELLFECGAPSPRR